MDGQMDWWTTWPLYASENVSRSIKIWPSLVTSTLGLPEGVFQMAHLQVMENICVKLFWNLSITVEVEKSWQIGMDGYMHIHRTVIVTTMSHSPKACSTKKNIKLVPRASPAKKAVPRLVVYSACFALLILWFVRSDISCTTNSLFPTPPSTL